MLLLASEYNKRDGQVRQVQAIKFMDANNKFT